MVAAGASNDDIMVHPSLQGRRVSPEPFLGDAPHTPVRHHILSVLVENKPGVLSARRRALRAPRLQHLLPGGRAQPRATPGSRASRSSSTPSRRRSSRSWASSTSWSTSWRSSDIAPADAVERELLLATITDQRRRTAPPLLDVIGAAGAAIVDVDADAVTVMLAGTPGACDEFERVLEEFTGGRAPPDRPRGAP